MKRVFVLIGLLSLIGLVPRAFAQGGSAVEDSAAFFKEFPLGLVYRGVALYAAKDYEGAISAWQGYLDRGAGNTADSAGVNELIRDAWIHAYPMSLVYDGYARYQANDIVGAINSLERYIQLAPAGTDTASIRDIIVHVLVPQEEMAKVSQKTKR